MTNPLPQIIKEETKSWAVVSPDDTVVAIGPAYYDSSNKSAVRVLGCLSGIQTVRRSDNTIITVTRTVRAGYPLLDTHIDELIGGRNREFGVLLVLNRQGFPRQGLYYEACTLTYYTLDSQINLSGVQEKVAITGYAPKLLG